MDRWVRGRSRHLKKDLDFGAYYALVIGNNAYQYLPELDTAMSDAKAVSRLLEKEYGFDPGSPAPEELRDFVAQRLTSGAEMLRALWWSAWVESEELAAQRRARGWRP